MKKVEVLVLNGSPGSGKSTLAEEISEQLRIADIPNAIIDIDELARIYPEKFMNLAWDNLAAIWNNYVLVPGIKMILPVCIDTQIEFDHVKKATPCNKFTICELTAPFGILKQRVIEREPNEYWKNKLVKLVEAYDRRPVKFGDFQIDTSISDPESSAKEIITRLGWQPRS